MDNKGVVDRLKKWGRTIKTAGLEEAPSDQTRADFVLECVRVNRIAAFVILTMMFAMECIMAVIYFVRPYFVPQVEFFPQYIYLYISMILLSACFLVLFNLFQTSPAKLMRLEFVIIVVIEVWSAVFSAFDVINGFSSYLFIQIIIINSLVFKINPLLHCVVNAGSYLVYTVLISKADLDLATTFAELVNPFFMIAAACVIVVLNYQIKFAAYKNQHLIQEQNRKLAFYADNDFLTKTANRKSIEEYLDQVVLKDCSAVACLMIDIDNFKLYNDTYGHIMGDTCLIKIASVIKSCAESRGGRAGRYGGEEFLVIFTDKDEETVIKIADEMIERIRKEKIQFAENGDPPFVTSSIGIYIEKKAEAFEKTRLIASADTALYKAKKEGKNKISVYQGNSYKQCKLQI